MRFIIGGYAQGKLNFALQKYNLGKENVFDGFIPDTTEKINDTVIINHLNTYIRQSLVNKKSPQKEIFDFIERYPDCVFISDEVGNGIVPIDAFEREFRETTGRIQIELAKSADEVERVICGIGQRIK